MVWNGLIPPRFHNHLEVRSIVAMQKVRQSRPGEKGSQKKRLKVTRRGGAAKKVMSVTQKKILVSIFSVARFPLHYIS